MAANQSNTSKSRLSFIDAAKGFGMLLIMFGHITDLSNPVDTWASSFKVSIFYIVSGFLYAYTQSPYKRDFRTFTSRIAHNLLVPYFWFSLLGMCAKALFVFLKHKGRKQALFTFFSCGIDCLFFRGINSLWFLPTMIFGSFLFYLIIHSPKPVRFLFVICGLFAIRIALYFVNLLPEVELDYSLRSVLGIAPRRLIPATGKAVMAAWFISVGYFLYFVYKKYFSNRTSNVFVGLALTIFNIVVSHYNIRVDINLLKEGIYPVYFYIGGIIGSFGIILLLDGISETISLAPLSYLGRNSLIIMATHTVWGLRTLAYQGWKFIAYIPDKRGLEYICECTMVLIVLLLLEYPIIEFINKHLPFLINKCSVVDNVKMVLNRMLLHSPEESRL